MGQKSTKKKMQMQFSAHLSNITEVNESFDKGLMRICYHGNNRNMSRIRKSVIEQYIDRLAYVPVVANYEINSDSIGSHDSKYIEDKDGKLKHYNITMPLGLVPENFKWYWEDVTESDGTVHEYLCCEVLLWKRQPVYEHVINKGVTDQSMELDVHDGSFEDDGYYDIRDFTFTALCLLESAEPCFESASLHVYSTKESFKADCDEMYKEFKALFTNQSSDGNLPSEGVDIETNQEGGNYELTLNELMEKYNVKKEDISFETDGLDAEQLETAFKEAFDNDDSDNDDSDNDDSADDQYALNSQIREELYEAISAEKVSDDYGSYSKYWMMDYDTDASEVYALDSSDYKLYGFTYSTSGDSVKVDFDSKKKKKYSIVDFVDGDAEFSLEEFVKPIVDYTINKCKSETETEFNKKFDGITVEEINRLQEFEKDSISKETKEAKKAIFDTEAYEKIKETDDFKKLIEDMDKFSVEEIEVKCDGLLAAHVKANLGSYSFNTKDSSNKQNYIRTSTTKNSDSEEYKPYGNLMEEFVKNQS